MGYLEYSDIEELIFNKSFQNWVLTRDEKDAAFWEDWALRHPEKKKLLNDAKAIVFALQLNFKNLGKDEIQAEIRKVLQKINKTQELDEQDQVLRRRSPVRILSPRLGWVAACLILPICYFYIYPAWKDTKKVKNHAVYLAAEKNLHAVDHQNRTDTAVLVKLPDGSTVWLEPGSHLKYERNFSDTDRKVYLDGEAFFNIERKPSQPFFVFTNTIITEVLGTSFRVKAYANDKKTLVTVSTGKVSVFKPDSDSGAGAEGRERPGIIVTPNQTAEYSPADNELIKTLAERPVLTKTAAAVTFSFDATPVREVFRRLQDAYSIPIIYDDEVISSCSLSASLGDESFYEKLDLICKAINASYEKMDGTIIITSQGCK